MAVSVRVVKFTNRGDRGVKFCSYSKFWNKRKTLGGPNFRWSRDNSTIRNKRKWHLDKSATILTNDIWTKVVWKLNERRRLRTFCTSNIFLGSFKLQLCKYLPPSQVKADLNKIVQSLVSDLKRRWKFICWTADSKHRNSHQLVQPLFLFGSIYATFQNKKNPSVSHCNIKNVLKSLHAAFQWSDKCAELPVLT